MNARLYIGRSEISFDFDTEEDRDLFFENSAGNPTAGFAPKNAAEKVGKFTIKVDPKKYLMGYTLPITFR